MSQQCKDPQKTAEWLKIAAQILILIAGFLAGNAADACGVHVSLPNVFAL